MAIRNDPPRRLRGLRSAADGSWYLAAAMPSDSRRWLTSNYRNRCATFANRFPPRSSGKIFLPRSCAASMASSLARLLALRAC